LEVEWTSGDFPFLRKSQQVQMRNKSTWESWLLICTL